MEAKEILENTPENAQVNVFMLFKSLLPDNKEWNNLSVDNLIIMIERYLRQMENKSIHPYSSSFRNLICSIIQINCRISSNNKNEQIKASNNVAKYDLKLATKHCLTWKNKFPHEPESFYYLALFELIKGN
jgi:hypothetical protein